MSDRCSPLNVLISHGWSKKVMSVLGSWRAGVGTVTAKIMESTRGCWLVSDHYYYYYYYYYYDDDDDDDDYYYYCYYCY